jgi:hypothetical protein
MIHDDVIKAVLRRVAMVDNLTLTAKLRKVEQGGFVEETELEYYVRANRQSNTCVRNARGDIVSAARLKPRSAPTVQQSSVHRQAKASKCMYSKGSMRRNCVHL